MAIPLNINGAVFEYPENFDEAWGINATGWAQAVTNGMLQRQGGSFPLTADVNFGASFGLVSLYYKSRSTPIATTGTVRLASADSGIAFRNNANSGNLVLTTDSSDSLVYPNGMKLAGTVLLQNDNAIGFQDTGSVHTITMKSPSTTANYTITLPPNPGVNGQVLATDGAGTTTWINTAGSGTVNSGTTGQVAYYATTGTTLDGASFLNFSSPTLTYNSGTSLSRLSLNATGGEAELRFAANGFTNDIDSDSSGNLRIQDITNSRNILTYLRAGPQITTSMPLDMGSNQITSVANGIASTDAVAFGQVQYGFQNAVQFSSLGAASVSSGSYTTTGISVTITPTSASSRIKISVTGSVGTSSGHISIFRNSTNLAGSDKDFAFYTSSASLGIAYIDSPATTSATTYTIYAKGTVTVGGASILTTLIAEELR